MTPCAGQVWVGWRYKACQNDASHRLGDLALCSRCLDDRLSRRPVQAAPPEPDESSLAREQLAGRFAGRIAERMGWGGILVEGDAVCLTAEQAAELAERLEGR